jgi:hypothetical protein
VHELKQPGYASEIYFCNWLLQNVQDGVMDPQQQFITDEAIAQCVEYMNMEQTRKHLSHAIRAITQCKSSTVL